MPHSVVPFRKGSSKEAAQGPPHVNKSIYSTDPLTASERFFNSHPFPDVILRDSALGAQLVFWSDEKLKT
jgi:hypothetical protein